ncbi:50S ribosomal protein L10 [Candidatus Schneideria nysicola]|uniref:50S ribosomal protein L10 n=1 Tax=Candidatus Schneideria nysicola TaxID=1081631 RepID=UPI001CAA481E|nr:50S ribosomal protein L10 [Candidatus Schneideria nysicola]UAJ66014.1 50S ribosomal protein L10 [Candidatus Schneideria nysicola]
MSLNIDQKKAIVTEMRTLIINALSIIVADYRGITVNEMTALRKMCREKGVYIRVIPNSLMLRIVTGTNFESIKHLLVGQILIAFSTEHPGTPARILRSFYKEKSKLDIKAANFQGKLLIEKEQIDLLANLPTYNEAIERLIWLIKEASLIKLIRVMKILSSPK